MFRAKILVVALLALTVFAIVVEAQTASTMVWSAGPNLNSARSSAATAVSSDGIYVFGGATASTTSVEKLVNGSNFWLPATLLNVGLTSPGVGGSPARSGMTIFGGKDNRRAVKDVFSYDITGAIVSLPTMKIKRYQHAYAQDVNGIVYAIGGKDDLEVPTATAERAFPSSRSRWLLIPSLPEARFNFPAATDSFNRILTFGGSTVPDAFTSTVYRFDGSSWVMLAPMPIATSGSCAVAGANNMIYVIGGTSAGGAVDAVQIYHVLTNTWTVGTSLPTAVSNANAVINSAGKIVVIGGSNAANQNVTSVVVSDQESAPPIITSFPNTRAAVGVGYGYQVTSTGNPAATYSLLVNPIGMTIDTTTGVIAWTPANGQVGTHSVTVRAANASGSVDQSFQISVPPPAPTGLAASNITANTALLSWNPAPVELGPVTYNIYLRVCRGRGGCGASLLVSGITATEANLSGLVSGASYGFFVATNFSGTISPFSIPAFLTTLSVGAPTSVTTTVTQNSVTLSWLPPAISGVPVVGYRVAEFVSGSGLVIRADNIADTTATISGLLSNSTHLFYVAAFDANNNQSFYAGPVSVTTSSVPVAFHNLVFPRAVGGGFYAESVVGVIGDRLMVISPDAHSSAGLDYMVSGSGSPAPTFSIASAPGGMTVDPVTGIVSWVPAGPTGTFSATIRATNSQGFGDFTFTFTVYPQGTDLLSPTSVQPFQSSVINPTQTTVTLSWTAAVDNVGIAGYRIYAVTPLLICGTRTGCPPLPTVTPIAITSGTGTTVTLTGLTPNSGYSYWIEAFDAAGNTSFIPQGVQRSFTTLP